MSKHLKKSAGNGHLLKGASGHLVKDCISRGCPETCADCASCGVTSVTFSGFSGNCPCCDFLNDTWDLSDVCAPEEWGNSDCYWKNTYEEIDESDATSIKQGQVWIDVYCGVDGITGNPGRWQVLVSANLSCIDYDENGSDVLAECTLIDGYTTKGICADSSTQCPNKAGLTFEFPAGVDSGGSDMCSDLSQDADTNPRTAVVN